MSHSKKDLIRLLLILGFAIANFLWIKTLFDIHSYQDIKPSFSFPKFFTILFLFGSFLALGLTIICLKSIWKSNRDYRKSTFDFQTFLIWLAIPISVLCTSLVCYLNSIFITSYLPSTIIRIGLLIVPLIAGFLYYKGKREISILILLCICFLLLIPNDKCYNAFNHWWIDKIGASPLTYLPTMFVMLFSITGFFGKNKNLIITIVYGLSAAALFISIGHRTRLLW